MSRSHLALRVMVLSGLERYGSGVVLDDAVLNELAQYIEGEVSVSEGVLMARRGDVVVHVLVPANTADTHDEADASEDGEEWTDEMGVDYDRG